MDWWKTGGLEHKRRTRAPDQQARSKSHRPGHDMVGSAGFLQSRTLELPTIIIARGLVPAIYYVFDYADLARSRDARHKAGHDGHVDLARAMPPDFDLRDTHISSRSTGSTLISPRGLQCFRTGGEGRKSRKSILPDAGFGAGAATRR